MKKVLIMILDFTKLTAMNDDEETGVEHKVEGESMVLVLDYPTGLPSGEYEYELYIEAEE